VHGRTPYFDLSPGPSPQGRGERNGGTPYFLRDLCASVFFNSIFRGFFPKQRYGDSTVIKTGLSPTKYSSEMI
jgi:hypothetical protein